MNIKSSLRILLFALLGAAPAAIYAAASGEHTAAHVKAYAEELEGEKVSLDVVFIRMHRHSPEEVPYIFFWAVTIDEDAQSGGGSILVVADKDDKDALVRRYGTNLDRDADGPKYKSMRGTVRFVEREGRGRHVYFDITDNGVDLTNAPAELLSEDGGNIEIPAPPAGNGGGDAPARFPRR